MRVVFYIIIHFPKMNRRQKIVLLIGVIFVLFSGLFPPYEGQFLGENLKTYIGHYFLFDPPKPNDIIEVLLGGESYRVPNKIASMSRFTTKIILSRFVVIVSTIVFVTAGLILFFSNSKSNQNQC